MSGSTTGSSLPPAVAEPPRPEADRFQLGLAEKAAWRKAVDPVFRGRLLNEVAQALHDEVADHQLLLEQVETALADLRVGRASGLRFFFHEGREPFAQALAKVLRIAPDILSKHFDSAMGRDRAHRPTQPPVPEPNRVPSPIVSLPEQGDVKSKRATFDEMLQRSMASEAEHAADGDPSVQTALDEWAVPILTELALGLLRRGSGPLEAIERPSLAAERVLALHVRSLADGPRTSRSEGLRTLRTLLNRFPDLARQAGWLRTLDETGDSQAEQINQTEAAMSLRFTEPRLPSLLLGRALALTATQPEQVQLVEQCGRDRRWSLAVVAAVMLGTPAHLFVRPLLDETDPLLLPERIAAAIAALAEAQPDSLTADEFRRAFTLGMGALVWLFPAQRNQFAQVADIPSPWFLDLATWQQSILLLAEAEGHIKRFGIDVLTDQLWQESPEPLGSVVRALGLPLRLDDGAARAVLSLCAPRASVRTGWLSGTFWREVFGTERRLCYALRNEAGDTDHVLETWTLQHAGPALLETGDANHLQALAEPGEYNPAGFLLNRPKLIPLWAAAWERLLSAGDTERAIAVWVQAALRHMSHKQGAQSAHQSIAEETPKRLRALGLWTQAAASLRAALTPNFLPQEPSEEELRNCSSILHLAEISKEEWERLISEWTEQPTLPWRAIIEGGVPHKAIAVWSVNKLRQKAAAGPDGVRGPTGILISAGAVMTAQGRWQLAFEQAERALEWLLEYGDEESIALLADACMPSVEGQEPVNPSMLRSVGNIDIPLSMFLWHKVIVRPEGRRVLYSRAEKGLPLAALIYFPKVQPFPMGFVDSLWTLVTLTLLPSHKGNPYEVMTKETHLEAMQLFRAYRAWYEREAKPGSSSNPARNHARHAVTLVAGMMGVDVEPHFSQLVRENASECRRLRPPERQWTLFVSSLVALILFHPQHREGILATLAEPDVLCALRADDTQKFWKEILSQRSIESILSVFEQSSDKDDIGLGLFDTVCDVAPERVAQLQLRPDFLRPVLIRSVDGKFVPLEDFWSLAWHQRPEGLNLDALGRLPRGGWLDQLIERSLVWPTPDRLEVLRRLATFAQHADVRRQSLLALLTHGQKSDPVHREDLSHD